MSIFRIEVTRIGYACRVIEVEATTQDDAERIALVERIVGPGASDVTAIGGNTDVLFHAHSEAYAAKLGAEVATRIGKLKFVEAIAINPPLR